MSHTQRKAYASFQPEGAVNGAANPLPTDGMLAGERLRRRIAIYASVTIVVPALVTVIAVVDAVQHGLAPYALIALGVMYAVTAIGITVGFHRHFAHRSFVARPWLRMLLGIAGSMAAQGPVLNWASTHRRHHQNTEKADDPHSPYIKDGKPLGWLAGLWHSHLGWMITGNFTNPVKYTPDLLRDRRAIFVNRHYLLWVAAGIVLPGVATGLAVGSLHAFAEGVMWGGFVRLFLVHHAFWIIGSLAHIVGVRTFATNDGSRNNFFSAIVNLGEGWHNNHHAFSSSARFGLRWYQLDVGYLFILAMRKIGAIDDIRQPSAADMQARKITEASRAK